MSLRTFPVLSDLSKTQKRNLISTPGCLHQSRRKIFKDKLLSSKTPIQLMKLSKTLDPGLISEEKELSPFWKESLQDQYQKLWLPIETDLQDLALSCLNTSLKDFKCPLECCQMMTSKSLLQSSQRTSYRSLQFSVPDTTDQEAIKGETIACKKIRFYPNENQLELFNKCLGASRFFYNRAVSIIEETGVKGTGILNLKTLRPLVMQSDQDVKGSNMEWQMEVPYDTRQEAISDAITSYKSALTNLRNNNISHFSISFRCKKGHKSQCFKVNKRAFNLEDVSIFPARLKASKTLRVRKRDLAKLKDIGEVAHNFTVIRTRPDYWYLCLPRTKNIPVYENATYKSVFLDPGVRTFQTFYSPEGVCGKIGCTELTDRLKPLAARHDSLWSVMSKLKRGSRKRANILRRCAKLRRKIQNIVDDLHWRTISFLCDHFHNIFIPEFKVSEMVVGSPLGSKITRKMLQLSHGLFKQRLSCYAKTKHRNVFVVGEAYTTKTCGSCGGIKDMNSLKTYDCPSCGCVMDRDIGAARNICLKLITKLLA